MAQTWTRKTLHPVVTQNSYTSWIERVETEGTSQSFPSGSPLSASSGRLVVFVAPTTAKVAAWALQAASGTAGASINVLLATAQVEVYGTVLTTAAATTTIAQTDLYTAYDLATSTTLEGTGNAGWYILKTTSDPTVTISQFRSDFTMPNVPYLEVAAGDSDARVKAMVTPGKSLWY